MNKPIQLRNWNMGGISESRILGESNESLFKMVGLDIHGKLGLLSANRKLVNSGSTVIDGFIKNIIACSNGYTYAFSATSGKIWDWDGTDWTLVYTASSPYGSSNILGAYEYNGYLYFATQNYLYRIQLENTDQTWSSFVEEVGKLNLDRINGDTGFLGGTGAEYALGTSIVESATTLQSFIPQGSIIAGFTLNVTVKPSTSLTITLHSASNASLGTVTVANANLVVGLNEIYFSSPIEIQRGATVHIHVTQTGTGGKVNSLIASDLASAYLEVIGLGNSSYHPMTVVNNVLFIGDRNYIHQFENSLVLWALDLPQQHTVKCLYKMDIELLIGTEVSSLIHSAMIFRWNTWSESWTIEDEIPERSINAFIPVDNFVYVIAGNKLNIYFYNGERLELFRRIAGEYSSTDSMLVHPNAVSSLNGIPLIGVSSGTNNPIEAGVYSMGTANPRLYPRVFNMEYVLSEGLTGVEIGAIALLGDQIFISWKKNTSYGVDMFDGTKLHTGAYFQTRTIFIDRDKESTYTKLNVNYAEVQDYSDAVTFNATGELVVLNAHGFNNGEQVKFSGASIPAELTAGTSYYVISATANNFQVSATEGGSAIAFASNGSGTVEQVYLVRAYYRENYDASWTEVTLIHDTDHKQFTSANLGISAYCFEIKIEIRSRGTKCPLIDEISLYSN